MAGMQKGQSDGSVGGDLETQVNKIASTALKMAAGSFYGKLPTVIMTEDAKGFLAGKDEGWVDKKLTKAVLKDTEGFIKMPAGVKLAPIDMDPNFSVKPMETPNVASSGGRGGGTEVG
jgi:hypothetical protein